MTDVSAFGLNLYILSSETITELYKVTAIGEIFKVTSPSNKKPPTFRGIPCWIALTDEQKYHQITMSIINASPCYHMLSKIKLHEEILMIAFKPERENQPLESHLWSGGKITEVSSGFSVKDGKFEDKIYQFQFPYLNLRAVEAHNE